MPQNPTFHYEAHYPDSVVAGVDEAGRGPWAGPVVAAAVILRRPPGLRGIQDSKQLKAEAREQLYARIIKKAQCFSIGMASVEEIDTLNILAATKLAMQRAVEQLGIKPCVALVDGNQPPDLSCTTHCVIKGDGMSLSIAAASILAKVTRDRLMRELAREYPQYGFERHAGYGTACHQKALAEHGVTPHHRKSFAPIRLLLEARAAA